MSDTATRLAPAPRNRLVDIAYERLRAGIIEGNLAMGSRLKETHLAAELQVSRGPVKLAIQRLVEEGLVDERPHQGAIVREIDGPTIVDLYNVRVGLERVAFGIAAKQGMDTSELKRLAGLIRAAAQQADTLAVARHEWAFHTEVFEQSNNPVLTQLFHGLEARILMALTLDDEGFENLSDVADEYDTLIAAIDSRDEEAAMDAVQRCILSTVSGVVTRLGGDPELLLTNKNRKLS
ncbi:GntR family transcriptional regulator [Arthrobacter sp. EpRS71]|uniref:GntR family transcriptional regulator n=1 Tax=Arthrobacter sp. EpRS71 TaxID=1743141 RepID=UPI001E472744|nr:GntR family transcriptional regulator [Arthrobacter sp. EpRS71]